jgi:hypothetical protein
VNDKMNMFNRGEPIVLSCGVTINSHEIDLGMRELKCECGNLHAVVTDVNPLTRFLPDFLVNSLAQVIEVVDSERWGGFGMAHIMGLVIEECPEEVTFFDSKEDGYLGYSALWITEFNSFKLHEMIVELIIEIMEHAVSHSKNEISIQEFEKQMLSFNISEFVEKYREERDLDPEKFSQELF